MYRVKIIVLFWKHHYVLVLEVSHVVLDAPHVLVLEVSHEISRACLSGGTSCYLGGIV